MAPVVQEGSLVLSTSTLAFNATQGAGDPANQEVHVTNGGPGNLNGIGVGTITYQTGNGWLSAVVVGQVTATVTITCTTGALTAGTYVGTVPITDGNASNSPQNITVTFNVQGAPVPPVISLSPSTSAAEGDAGGAAVDGVDVTVSNAGGGTLTPVLGSVTYQDGSGWASVSLNGNVVESVFDPGALASGRYRASVPVTATGASNSPQTISLVFEVATAGAPTLSLTTATSFSATEGGGNPPNKQFTISNGSGIGSLAGPAVGAISYGSGSGWLTTATITGSGPTYTLTVGVTTGALTAGDYTATFPITDANASNSPQTFSVTFTVGAGGTSFPAPSYTLPTGISFNTATGDFDGTVMATAYALPSGSVTHLADTGNANTNRTNLQNALNNAARGDIITFPANATYQIGSSVTYPAKGAGTDWIYLMSRAFYDATNTCAEGTRIHPTTHAADLATLSYSGGSNPSGAAMFLAANSNTASYLRCVGLKFTGTDNAGLWNQGSTDFVRLGVNPTSSATRPHHIGFDRCVFQGHATKGIRFGVLVCCDSFFCVDSYFSEIHSAIASEPKCIQILASNGPYKVVNNYLECAGINLMTGGEDPPPDASACAQDIEFRRNWVIYPASYVGGVAGKNVMKNLFELKYAKRVLVEGNVFRGSRTSGQSGMCTNLKTSVAKSWNGSSVPNTEDVTWWYNKIWDVNIGWTTLGLQTDQGFLSTFAQRATRYSICHNFFSISTGIAATDSGPGFGCQLTGETGSLEILHNTFTKGATGAVNAAIDLSADGYQYAVNNLTVRYNIFPRGQFRYCGGGGFTEGTSALNGYCNAWAYESNAHWGNTSVAGQYPAGNFFEANEAAIGYTDAANGDYSLGPSSNYLSGGTKQAADGTDMGADWTRLNARTSGVDS